MDEVQRSVGESGELSDAAQEKVVTEPTPAEPVDGGADTGATQVAVETPGETSVEVTEAPAPEPETPDGGSDDGAQDADQN